MRECMLTTNDNPFDPFDNFEEWYKIDMQLQHNTSALVARLVPSDDSLPHAYMEAMKEEILNKWCASAVGEWIPSEYIMKCSQTLKLEDWSDYVCYVGLD